MIERIGQQASRFRRIVDHQERCRAAPRSIQLPAGALQHVMYDRARRDTVLGGRRYAGTLSLLTDTLDHAGFTVLIATDGLAALELIQLVTPDLVLMDAVMPGISGFETCKRLKRDGLLSHLPVIFMTGLSETEHVVEGLACGGVDYVTKPIVLEELLARIRVHLNTPATLTRRTRRWMPAAAFCSPSIMPAASCGARRKHANISARKQRGLRTRRGRPLARQRHRTTFGGCAGATRNPRHTAGSKWVNAPSSARS